ncbi:hypothetical protein EDD15DRAFT_2190579 [Pisolithus albus]|nr:hypothetical protein EDD15DRAFT_2190579 [Pisolithus albus]
MGTDIKWLIKLVEMPKEKVTGSFPPKQAALEGGMLQVDALLAWYQVHYILLNCGSMPLLSTRAHYHILARQTYIQYHVVITETLCMLLHVEYFLQLKDQSHMKCLGNFSIASSRKQVIGCEEAIPVTPEELPGNSNNVAAIVSEVDMGNGSETKEEEEEERGRECGEEGEEHDEGTGEGSKATSGTTPWVKSSLKQTCMTSGIMDKVICSTAEAATEGTSKRATQSASVESNLLLSTPTMVPSSPVCSGILLPAAQQMNQWPTNGFWYLCHDGRMSEAVSTLKRALKAFSNSNSKLDLSKLRKCDLLLSRGNYNVIHNTSILL